MPNDTIDCPALHGLSKHYPARFRGKVPESIRMLQTVRADEIIRLVDPAARKLIAEKGQVYKAWTNSHGAVCAVLYDRERLGLKPPEFEVVSWHS